MRDAFIVDGIRTAIGGFGGSFSSVRADDLGAHVIAKLLERSPDLKPQEVGDVIFGCANQAGEDNRNVARMSALLAGLPWSVPGETVNRLCASGMAAVVNAARAISTQSAELYIAGGVEQMTRAPYVLSKGATPFARNVELFDTSIGWRFINPKMKERYGVDSMGQTAENVAETFRISRDDQDLFALRSQQKAAMAERRGRFAREIVGITIDLGKGKTVTIDKDEHPRPETTIEGLAKLKPAFRTDGRGSVTAGNSSGINDGAAALLIASETAIKRYNLKPRARIVDSTVVGVEPRLMGIGPVTAVLKLLQRAQLKLNDVAVIELNEAFAAQALACLRELKLPDDDQRVNRNGGAIALGHPLGMSGARLLLSAALELEELGERYAICTMCIGVGQGMATLIERV